MIPFKRVTSRAVAYEHSDCTVLACSIVLDIPYKEMHTTLAVLGRQDCSGLRTDWLGQYLRSNGCNLRGEFCNIKLEQLLPQISKGKYLLLTNDHVFALVDGTIIDYSEPNKRKVIIRVYERKDNNNS